MTSFTSTAAFYSRYRVPYPESLLDGLKTDADLRRESLVLDLATGPGRLALASAPSVREVVAVDIEPEMLDEGRCLARGKDIANVRWVHSGAEDLAVVPGSVELVTIGEAFHRLDQSLILQRIGQWLKDDACVALVGCFGVMHGEHAWQESLLGALTDWTKEPLDGPPATPRGKDHDMRRLIEAGFAGVVKPGIHRFPRLVPRRHPGPSAFDLPILVVGTGQRSGHVRGRSTWCLGTRRGQAVSTGRVLRLHHRMEAGFRCG